MAKSTTTPGGTPIPQACVIGGTTPGGNPNPCETIAIDLVEAWRIDEATGSVAAGELGVADLTLTPYNGSSEDAWNAAGDDDAGRKFFAGYGVATLSPALGLLKHVGDSITIAQRRWATGLQHVRAPLPFSSIGFGSLVYTYFDLVASSGASPPRVYARPGVDFSAGGSGPWPVNRRGLYRGAYPNATPIPGTTAGLPGIPALFPPSPEPAPYLVVVTATMIAPDVISFSILGGDGVYTFAGVCYNSNADASVPDTDGGGGVTSATGYFSVLDRFDSTRDVSTGNVPSSFIAGDGEDAGVGELGLLLTGGSGGDLTVLGDLTTLTIGGTGSYDTIHQAAIWKRALTPAEIAWLCAGVGAGSLDRLFATLDAPGSQCAGGGACAEGGGLGTANPLITPAGDNALSPSKIKRLDAVGVLATAGVELRNTRRTASLSPRTYELVWEDRNLDAGDFDRVIDAVRVTHSGSTWTRWRHPIDDPSGDGTPCSAIRYRIRNASELSLVRGRGGHVGGLRLVLEEMV